jgi:hypothetical protein
MRSTLIHQGLTLLLLTGWCFTTAGLGRLCLSFTGICCVSRGEQLFLSSGIGLIAIGYAVFLLGITNSLNSAPISILLAALGILSLAGWLRKFPCNPLKPALRSAWDRPASFLLVFILLIGFLQTMTPEIGKDALIYHLAAPKLYLLHRGIYLIPGNVFAGYPLLGEMHYLLALFLRDDTLARAMHYTVLCGTLLGICLFTRFIVQEHAFPALSMLIFVSIPSVFFVSHMAYNDLFVTFFTLAAIYSFLRWSEQRTFEWLVICGIFSGSAAACKYTALLLMPLGCLGVLWLMSRLKAGPLQALRLCSVYISVAFVAGSPFYLKNWIVTGNPFYPFFYELFGGLLWDADQARLYDLFIRELGMGRSLTDYLLLPWNLSFRAKMESPQFDGILGPVFILILPFLIGNRRWDTPVRILLAYTAITFLFWASSAQQIRYLIPLFPLLAIVSGAILTRYRSRKIIFGFLLFIIAGSLFFNGYHIFRDFMKVRPLSAAVGFESRDEFLTRMIPPYPMYLFVNRQLPPESRVFLIYMKNYTFLCDRDCYADAMFEAHTLQKILRRSLSPVHFHDLLKGEGFTHLLYDETYLLGDMSPLIPDEKKLFLSFRKWHCTLVKQNHPYRLDRLNQSDNDNRGLPSIERANAQESVL